MIEKIKELSLEDVKSAFEYKDGHLYWKIDRSDKVKKGKLAGTNRNGYIQIIYKTKTYLAHRLIYFMHYGYLPKYIDHINGNRSDNRIENLRGCTQHQNLLNRKPFGKSKYKGVYLTGRKTIKYKSQIMLDGKLNYLGTYKTEEEAANAYNGAAKKLHKNFAYLNHIL